MAPVQPDHGVNDSLPQVIIDPVVTISVLDSKFLEKMVSIDTVHVRIFS